MPNEDIDKRYVIGKSTTATLDFAGVMAVAARVYEKFDATFAAKALDAAKKAYAWGSANPNVYYNQPRDVALLKYGQRFESEMMDLSVNIPLEKALDLGWEILADCFAPEETGIPTKMINEYWPKKG